MTQSHAAVQSSSGVYNDNFQTDWNTNERHITATVSNIIYLSGMNREEWVAPIPGLPCFTGLYEMENSAK